MQIDNEPALPRLIDVAGLMRLTNLSRPTIYRYIQRGELKPVRFGRRTMFTPASVTAWIASKIEQAA